MNQNQHKGAVFTDPFHYGVMRLNGQMIPGTYPPMIIEGLRRALHESFESEQEYRRTTLEALRRRQDEIEKRKDVLIERYLNDRIAEEEYQRKCQA